MLNKITETDLRGQGEKGVDTAFPPRNYSSYEESLAQFDAHLAAEKAKAEAEAEAEEAKKNALIAKTLAELDLIGIKPSSEPPEEVDAHQETAKPVNKSKPPVALLKQKAKESKERRENKFAEIEARRREAKEREKFKKTYETTDDVYDEYSAIRSPDERRRFSDRLRKARDKRRNPPIRKNADVKAMSPEDAAEHKKAQRREANRRWRAKKAESDIERLCSSMDHWQKTDRREQYNASRRKVRNKPNKDLSDMSPAERERRKKDQKADSIWKKRQMEKGISGDELEALFEKRVREREDKRLIAANA
ncbi:hypothetical protein [Mangrovicoccus ximenensis]|uniref:hypothetical protein n=1 Tax=Mangrovicoccus ximenensis TaxID=1911570 RepID=UPI0011AEC2E6|nr:hypothetical protein [Mangrovicoccus ximenensis]